jgi:hypothetical protein
MHLECGLELFLEVNRLVTAGWTDDDVQPAPVRRLESGQKRRRVAVDVNVGIDSLEGRHRGGTGVCQ